MARLIETLGGLWELALLAARNGMQLRGPYWRWRYETAFGTDASRRPPRREIIRMLLDYGRWVWRMKQARRPEGPKARRE